MKYFFIIVLITSAAFSYAQQAADSTALNISDIANDSILVAENKAQASRDSLNNTNNQTPLIEEKSSLIEIPTDSSSTYQDKVTKAPHSNDSADYNHKQLVIIDSTQLNKDSANKLQIELSADSSARYIQHLMFNDNFWRENGNAMKNTLQRLLYQYSEPYDSISSRLSAFRYDSISIFEALLYENDTLPVRWLNDSTMIFDTVAMEKDPFLTKQTILLKAVDTSNLMLSDTLMQKQFVISDTTYEDFDSINAEIDSLIHNQSAELYENKMLVLDIDTVSNVFIDTTYLNSKNIQLYRMKDGVFTPEIILADSSRNFSFSSDMQNIIWHDSTKVITASEDDPFFILPGLHTTDSLDAAVNTLLKHIYERDSVQVFLEDMNGEKTPFWLSANNQELNRFWIKNYRNDSITIWVGNPEKYDISLFLEEEVRIDRPEKRAVQEIPVPKRKPESDLVKIKPLELIPIYWDYGVSTMLAFNQTYLSNWSKGGESSVSTILDIKGEAQYNNKKSKTKWTNNGRLKYGSIITEEYGLRTNTDRLEINSQFNKVINSKIDFSTVFYMKNQIAKGFNFPNDSVPVSKFLNPGTFTLGTGIEYKPVKKTLINFSPLSYKNTFVLDTASIDQTNHGIDADKRTRQEMGGQIVAKNSITLMEGLDMSNSIRLFANYFSKPFNVDVDWEVYLEKRINWYFTIGLNLHLIYDKDIKFPVLDDDGEPVLAIDGTKLKEPKIQFKEFVGLNFSFRF